MTTHQMFDYKRHEQCVRDAIKKHAAELLTDEDFVQDCYLHFIETIASDTRSTMTQQESNAYIANNMAKFVVTHKRKTMQEDTYVLLMGDSIHNTEAHIDVMLMLNTLPEMQREVITRRFGIDGEPTMSYAEIANDLGISVERVHTIERHAFKYIRTSSKARNLRTYL